jgi:PAS domain S-box-containing protein
MSAFQDPDIYRNILETMPVGLCVVDMQRKIVLWSEGAERISGHLRYEILGHKCLAEPFAHDSNLACEWCGDDSPLALAIKTAHPAEAIGFLHHKAGHEIAVRMRAVPVRNAHGSVVGAAKTFEEQQAVSPENREASLKLAGCVDTPTGVASHAMIRSLLRETLGIFNEVHLPFSILCFRIEDLEGFRARFGPEAASQLVRSVARTLDSALWKTDVVGRWSSRQALGGEKERSVELTDGEFLVILNGCREDAVRAVRERLRHMLAADGIDWWGERRSLPIAIGQATAQPGDTVASLVERSYTSVDAPVIELGRAAATGGGHSSGS